MLASVRVSIWISEYLFICRPMWGEIERLDQCFVKMIFANKLANLEWYIRRSPETIFANNLANLEWYMRSSPRTIFANKLANLEWYIRRSPETIFANNLANWEWYIRSSGTVDRADYRWEIENRPPNEWLRPDTWETQRLLTKLSFSHLQTMECRGRWSSTTTIKKNQNSSNVTSWNSPMKVMYFCWYIGVDFHLWLCLSFLC